MCPGRADEADDEDAAVREVHLDPFTRAWTDAVQLAGRQYFSRQYAFSYKEMPPHVDLIKKDLERISTSEAVFLAVMVSFYNGELGGRMLRTLQASGLGDIVARLGPDHRRVLTQMIVAFERW